jgi:hypothetical protein
MYLSTVIAKRFATESAMLAAELVSPILQVNLGLPSFSVTINIDSINQGGKKVRQTMISEIAKFITKYVVGVFE